MSKDAREMEGKRTGPPRSSTEPITSEIFPFQNDKSKGKKGKNRVSTIDRMKEEGEALLKVGFPLLELFSILTF